ncbi:hypothetical protein MPH_00711 [Macrophomina phaseolina MS6]|uniref:SMP domain-containing protein n=1 Tax=Macrophomina phaseolina (strain MS6) TaxID=1126212 RepID=K2SA75_MACPH|nr:hypothetical protein MPH_00711 [Macrophomina phaseolina MS6]
MADKHVTQEVAKEGTQEAADMLNNEPEQVAQDDTVMVQTAERYALGQRLSSGSIAAQAQPIGDVPENLQKVGEVAQKKLDENPASLTIKDSKQDLSAEHMVLGHIPPKDSISASVQRTAAANDSSTKGNVSKETLPVIRARRQSVSAADQSHIAREKKYEHAAQVMKQKLENHPEDITKEDANHVSRRIRDIKASILA